MGADGNFLTMVEGMRPDIQAQRAQEAKAREERIATLESQLKDTTSKYNKLFITRNAAGGYIDKFGNRVTKAVNTAPTRRPSGSAGTNLKIQGTGTNLG
jgi:hypothetical protein